MTMVLKCGSACSLPWKKLLNGFRGPQDKNPDSFQWKLRPSVRRLADGSFAVLPGSLSRLRSSCQALLRPLCHGFTVTAGGSLAALPQILGFPGSLKSYLASFASQPLPPAPPAGKRGGGRTVCL